jgi:hypothetical protein
MRTVKNLVFIAAIIFSCGRAAAQTDSLYASQRALLFADSLLNSFHQNNLIIYTELSYPGVIQYYGGRRNFEEYVRRTKAIQNDVSPERIKLLQMINNTKEWQCVVQKTRESIIDNRRAIIITYMVGQSIDAGKNWTFFDVAFNPVENITFIMPDIFTALLVPQREVVYQKGATVGYN